MRYFLKINIEDKTVNDLNFKEPTIIKKYLPIENTYYKNNIFLKTLRYENNDPGIVEKNWDKPYFDNNEYFLFVGGSVYFRKQESDRIGKKVPTPKEILNIILNRGDNHYDLLKGNYYIILFSKNEKRITIYASPMHIHPSFFTLENSTFVFSNLLEYTLKSRKTNRINKLGLIEFSLFDHPLGMETLYENIYSPIGGQKIIVKNDKITSSLAYDIANWIHKKPKKRKHSLYRINEYLKDSIKSFTNNTNHFNIALTGGFDGRLNLSFLDQKRDYAKLQAFSYGIENSMQIKIPSLISQKLNFEYKPIYLSKEYEDQYPELGLETIHVSGGLTAFNRANYLYGYNKIAGFSRNCMLGQCDMIRPLYTNPAGAIFNEFDRAIFFNKTDPYNSFIKRVESLKKNGFVNEDIYTKENLDLIYNKIVKNYITPYANYSETERYYLYLYKENMTKFWQTECHVVDTVVNDYISFCDLDYIEELHRSRYCGLYKGIFASNQFKRRKAQDLYVDLMKLNNNRLNKYMNDRFYKPKWLKYGFIGYLMVFLGKYKMNQQKKKVGNDTFKDKEWPKLFYNRFKNDIEKNHPLFHSSRIINTNPYTTDNNYRRNRLISLKIWLQHLNLKE